MDLIYKMIVSPYFIKNFYYFYIILKIEYNETIRRAFYEIL